MEPPQTDSPSARRIRLAGLGFGLLVLAILIQQTGPARLLREIHGAGWVLFPIVTLWGVVYACNARAWQLLVPARPRSFTFPRAFLLSVNAFALNFATPLLAMGGEPFRMAGATRYLGRSRAVGSVVSFRFLHALAHVLVFLMAIPAAALLLPHTLPVLALLGIAAVILLLIAAFLLSQHRQGVFERAVALLERTPFLRPLALRLERHRPALQELDQELTAIHREAPWHFRRALGVELAGRLLSTMEYALILEALGLTQGIWHGFVIANLSSLVTNLLIFVPFELGTKEGGTYLIFGALGLDPALGMTAALLSRVRELSWLAIGLACGWWLDRDARLARA
ncbi:MAG: lysylphosphatidylglycerol synthase transmembrane domain-containing protein [Gemmatimonadota bacterium]